MVVFVEVKDRVLIKRDMRKSFRQRFAAISDRDNLQQKLIDHLVKFLNKSEGSWGLYKPMGSEISLNQLPELTPHIRWAYPVVTGEALDFYVPGPQGFTEGYAGISEPVTALATKLDILDLNGILIPGVGFDSSGVRLGKGQGHYDRALVEFSGLKIGICFSDMIEGQIPEDKWDVRMDYLATEIAVEAVN
jgi:5-formyltetrahydrofolate cyclo-ligase